jgi:PAS domain S-box-containing protein
MVLAVLLSELLHPVVPYCVDYVFLAAVVGTAWVGRRGPGLMVAMLAPLTLDYFFLPPLYTLGISREARPYVVPFLLSALAAAWMSSTLRSAREAREQLRQSEEKFRRILTNQPDVAWTGDEKGRVIYISPKKVLGLTGYSSQEICAGGLAFLMSRVHADDASRVEQAVENLFSGGGSFDAEFRFQRKDGGWIWLHNRAMGTYRQDGVALADGVISNVSERKRSESELRSKTAFFEAQANSTIDGILVVDADGRRVLKNRRFDEIFGIPPELLDGPEDGPLLRHVVQLTTDPESFLARVRHLYNHPGETSRDEIELTNGRVLDRYSSPVNGTGGRYYGRIWTFRDITERKRREDTLRQLSTAVEQSPVSVVITDSEGHICYANRKFTECTGYTLEEVRGKNPRFLNSGYAAREMYEALWTTIISGHEWRGEFRNRKKNGELYWEAAVISPIMDTNGAITHFVAVKEDITERRVLEGELRQAQKLEAIGQLAAGIAHEINTPIQFIADNLTFLEESWEGTFRLLEMYRSAVRDNGKGLSAQVAAGLRQEEQSCDLEFIGEEAPRAIAQSLEGARRVAKIVRAMKEFSHADLADKSGADLNQGIMSTIAIARNEWKYVAEIITELDETLPPVRCYPGDVN